MQSQSHEGFNRKNQTPRQLTTHVELSINGFFEISHLHYDSQKRAMNAVYGRSSIRS